MRGVLKTHAKKPRANYEIVERIADIEFVEDLTLSVHLDHSAGVVQYADNCALRPEMGTVLCISDRLADCVGARVPDRAVSKQFTDQIKAISLLARTHLVVVVLGVQRRAALFGIHRFHTCYLSLYLSNEFPGLKETFLLLFQAGAPVSLLFFGNFASLPALSLTPARRRRYRRNANVRESLYGSAETNRRCDRVDAQG